MGWDLTIWGTPHERKNKTKWRGRRGEVLGEDTEAEDVLRDEQNRGLAGEM